MQEFYTDDPKTFEDYGRIINKQHFKRIMALMEGSTVVVGGDSDESQCYIGMYVSGMMEPAGIPQNVVLSQLVVKWNHLCILCFSNVMHMMVKASVPKLCMCGVLVIAL